MSSRVASVSQDRGNRPDPFTDARKASTGAHGNVGAPALSRQQFLETLQTEKRRADRSRAPLSLVVMRVDRGGALDWDDVGEIVRDLRRQMRETDVIGDLGGGVLAFLLPYSDADGAAVFSKQIVERTGARAAEIEHASYTDPRFECLIPKISPFTDTVPLPVDAAGERKRWALAIKRTIDVAGSLVLLILLSPLLVAVAVAVKATSRGPVIFRQSRIGRNGVPFDFYKFRSMRVGGDDRVHREYVSKLIEGKHNEINEGKPDEPIYKLQSDSRITAVGRVLRKTSIDELPQLWNVLKGEMSLIGPRPPIPYEVEKYQSWHLRRLQEVRPGITGLWQVEGRSKTSFDEMVRLDLRYVRHWSLWLDFRILLKTVVVVVRGVGAD